MKNRIKEYPRPGTWEDIVDDLLEVACFAARESRRFLCEKLRRHKILAESIYPHPSFSIARLVIVVQEGMAADECWLFDPKTKRIRQFTYVPNGSKSNGKRNGKK